MDISGRVVRQLVNTAQESGRHSVTIDAGDLPAGVYFYQLKTADKSVQTKKMIIRK
jgi:phosphodiesterase/alkaline phosphatase D-like protein